MGTTLTFGQLHEAVKADWVNDEIMTKHRDLSNFSTADRVRALRASAEWCRAGAPGGSTRRLFSPEGPCALGHALLGLHEFPGDWVATTAGVGDAGAALLGTDLSDPRLTRASMWLAEVAAAFDSGHLEAAAWRLDKAADMLLAVERAPQDGGELTAEDFEIADDVFTHHEDTPMFEQAVAVFLAGQVVEMPKCVSLYDELVPA